MTGFATVGWSGTPATGLVLPFVEVQGEGIDIDAQGRLILVSERADSDHATLTRLTLTPPAAAGP